MEEVFFGYPPECPPTDALLPGPEGSALPLSFTGVAPDPDIPEVPPTNFWDE